jgi:hypothetical protein
MQHRGQKMKKILLALMAVLYATVAMADSVLIIDAGYSTVTANVKGRIEAAGHTTTVTTDVSQIPTATGTYQQVWDLRYSAALTAGEQTNYQAFVTAGGFAYFVTENPGCCMSRNNSVAALITALGGGATTIGANFNTAADVESNVNTTYMTSGITVNYAAVSAIVNSQGIPLISDGTGDVSGMSWIGRAGNLGQGVTGTIVTVADTNWLDSSRFSTAQGATVAQQQNVTALDDIIRGIVAGTVAGTISANGNGAGSQQQNQAPTVVSTAPGTPRVTSSAANGTATTSLSSTRGTTVNLSNVTTAPTTYVASARDAAVKNTKTIEVTRTTTVVGTTPRTTVVTATTPVTTVTTTTTPRTTTTVTTPVTVTTYSDGSTTSADGTPVTTTSTTNVVTQTSSTTNEVITTTVRDNIVQSASSDQKASVSAAGLKDALAVRRFNPFLVDAISTKDGAWATPLMGYAKTGDGSFRTSSIGFGAQKTVDENTFGIAGTFGKSDSNGFQNSTSNSDTYGATAYVLSRQSDVWVKGSVGFNSSEYSTVTSIPIFALTNSSKVKANNYYADLTFYTAQEYYGFRPLAGVIMNDSKISAAQESGSALLSTLPEKGSSFEARPYAGIRYDIDDVFGLETRVTHSRDFGTVAQVRASAKVEIVKDAYIELTAGADKGSNYTGAVGMIGLKINF